LPALSRAKAQRQSHTVQESASPDWPRIEYVRRGLQKVRLPP
jgi:hypothetical protein